MKNFRERMDARLSYKPDYKNANENIKKEGANIALIEVAESGWFDVTFCLDLCKSLRQKTPDCKLLLMCSEQDDKSVNKIIKAKGKNEIDDFVFYDISTDYLKSKLLSI